ncbi:Neuropeptide Y receptor-like Protein [Tribolium castaneum]|uniref:Neuropeptide Y receptor-like Protein n=1 Tax=Tribolium castaneum TaxID=7070 RepID=A0A139WE88_TRICA|nr:Neuropeptide Y receptor-like Protein [Tribolium castaneum]
MKSVSVTVSVLTLTFISIDRWYAICFPLKFKSTTGRAKTAIGIIWIVALACDIPEMIYVTTIPTVDEVDTVLLTQCAPTWSTETDTIFFILKMVLFYLIPLLFMSIAYLQIIRVLWKSGNVPHQIMDASGGGGRQTNTFAMNMNASTEGQLRSRRKAAKMLVAVVVMFAFCYFPVHLLSILRKTVGLKNTDGNRAFSLISHWLCYANSAVNPIIYNFMSGKFRKEFHRAFEHCCQRSGGHGFQFSAVYRKTEKDSGIASRTHSRTDLEIQRVNDFEPRHNRKGTKTSMLLVET